MWGAGSFLGRHGDVRAAHVCKVQPTYSFTNTDLEKRRIHSILSWYKLFSYLHVIFVSSR